MWHNELYWQKQTETEWWDGSQQGVCGSKIVLLIWDQPTTHSFRETEREREREKHLWIRALSTVTFVTAVCQLCSLSEWLTTHSQARPSTAVIIITLPLFWILNDSIKHIYETVWKWLLLKEVSSPVQSMRAVLRSSVLGTSIWSAPSKWQIKPQKPILSLIFSLLLLLRSIHALLLCDPVITSKKDEMQR